MKKLASLISTAIVASTATSSIQAQEELIYVAVEPCRVADTRQSADIDVYAVCANLSP